MTKRKQKRESATLFQAISQQVEAGHKGVTAVHEDYALSDELLAALPGLATLAHQPGSPRRELPQMKKFRFQLLHQWLTAHLSPCRVADVGGGKGLLAYLLQKSGWQATVIDPFHQPLPLKFKDLGHNKQVRLAAAEHVPHIDRPFSPAMSPHFDLLVAMHAHGCTIQLIDAAAAYQRRLILLPCCIIHEPLIPPPGIHWIQCLVDYALAQGLTVEPFRLNFRGQNIGLYIQPGNVRQRPLSFAFTIVQAIGP